MQPQDLNDYPKTLLVRDMNSPDFILFSQHGWSDNGNDISKLSKALVNSDTVVIAPSLGLLQTYLRIEPLIQKLEKIAIEAIKRYPDAEIKIMGHSMGGLIWLELLNRHPEWWDKIHSIVVIGSPIGGSDIARMIDPFGIGIGIARDLGKNRRPIAEKLAQKIPTLAIASDLESGSDGMVKVANTKFAYSQFICVRGIPHAALKCNLKLVPIIQEFWGNPQIASLNSDFSIQLIQRLQSIPGMTDSHDRDFKRAQKILTFPDGTQIRTWKNPARVDRVFVADATGKCLYGGYVGWFHAYKLRETLAELQTVYKGRRTESKM